MSYVVPLAFVKNLEKTLTVNTGALLTMSVSVNGGTPPYKHARKKDGQPVEGQTTDTFSKANTQSGDKGGLYLRGNGFCRTAAEHYL